jgi:LuxR family maltose regulon positive regulatory protein
LRSFEEDGQAALSLCRQALALLPAENLVVRAQVACAQLLAYSSSVNDVMAAVESGFQSVLLAQAAGQTALVIGVMAFIAQHMIGAGQLHEAQRLSQQAIQMGTEPGELVLSDVGYPTVFQAEILREWNELDAALSLAEEAISLCEQTTSLASLISLLLGYAILLRIHLSRGELNAARSVLQQVDRIGRKMNQPPFLYFRSLFTTIDQVRLWLTNGELDRAARWAQMREVEKGDGCPFACERHEVAYARILLAKGQSALALQRLESALQRATTVQRWGHVIEIRLLQAIAHQMRQEEIQALDALSKAIRLAEPEGYIRSFVDEGPPMAVLLSRLREQDRKDGLTPYLDKLLAAFPQRTKARKRQLKQERLR